MFATDILVSSNHGNYRYDCWINPLMYCLLCYLQQSLIIFIFWLLQNWVREFDSFGIRRQQLFGCCAFYEPAFSLAKLYNRFFKLMVLLSFVFCLSCWNEEKTLWVLFSRLDISSEVDYTNFDYFIK